MRLARRRVLVTSSIMIIMIGCSQQLPPSMSLEDRIPIALASIEDLSGEAPGNIDAFVAGFERWLKRDHIYQVHSKKYAEWGDSRHRLVVIPNPLRANDAGLSRITASGTFEKLEYGRHVDLGQAFAAYHIFGILGAASAADDGNDFVAGVQYRFDASADGRDLGLMLIRTAVYGDVRDRSKAEMIHEVQEEASRDLLYSIATALEKLGHVEFDERVFRVVHLSDIDGLLEKYELK